MSNWLIKVAVHSGRSSGAGLARVKIVGGRRIGQGLRRRLFFDVRLGGVVGVHF